MPMILTYQIAQFLLVSRCRDERSYIMLFLKREGKRDRHVECTTWKDNASYRYPLSATQRRG